jgi:hypothetical protein
MGLVFGAPIVSIEAPADWTPVIDALIVSWHAVS